MVRILRFLVTTFAIVGLAAIGSSALAQSKAKDKDRKEQGDAKGKKDGKEHKTRQQKHHGGKDLVGDKIRKDGKHAFHQNGKHTAYVDVKGGKIAGVTVTHSENGNVSVKKYKSTKKMAEAPTFGIQPESPVPVQAQSLGTLWIGYSYIDDYGDEIIYWFPYDMILDGDTGAIEYIPMD
jgi:hypothetical protein